MNFSVIESSYLLPSADVEKNIYVNNGKVKLPFMATQAIAHFSYSYMTAYDIKTITYIYSIIVFLIY